MAEAEIGKRPFHAFLSHAHVDRAQADYLYDFLWRVADVPVWYDAVNMPPGAPFAHGLYEAILNSRTAIILLSKRSVDRGWVEEEYRAAQNQHAKHKDFRVIPLRLDEVEPPDFLTNLSNIEIGQGELNSTAAAQILKALYLPPHITPDPAHGKHTYFSRGWQASDTELAGALAGALSQSGLCLVGDAEDQPTWDADRISGIMDGCGAFAAVLPYRPGAPHTTSKYVLREWRLAAEHDLPCMVIPHPEVKLPTEAQELPGLLATTSDVGKLFEYAANLAEEWRTPRHAQYIFYATDFGSGERELRTRIKETVEAATGVPCLMGEYVTGSSVQREILRTVVSASMVIADITEDSPNVYIEVGAARSAEIPVALLRKGPPGRPTFMLRDQQVYDYLNDTELVGRALRVAYPYRRFLQV
jgi:TIR domain